MNDLSPLVGRVAEMRQLQASWARAIASRQPEVALVVGDPGAGKSRLVREFLVAATRDRIGVTVLHGRCPAAGSGSSYWPLAEALRALGGIRLDDDPEAAGEELRRHVDAISGGTLAPTDRRDLVHALAATAGLAYPDNPLARAEPRAVGAAIRRAWPVYLAACARQGAILVIDDVHWADAPLLEVVESVHASAPAGLLCLMTARPAIAERWPDGVAERERWQTVTLPPLTSVESAELVQGLVGDAHLDSRVTAAVAARAAGNPFHVEEAIRHLIGTGAIAHAGATPTISEPAGLPDLPATIRELLEARIRALPPAERRVLETAAIVGKTFWDGAVVAASGMSEVTRELASLEAAGLVNRAPRSSISGQREYQFRHALIRDAAHEGLLVGRRARAHVAVGTWLEAVARDRVIEVDEFVAEHLRDGVQDGDAARIWDAHPDERELFRVRAFRRLCSAGASARQRYAIARAIELHRQASGLAASSAERAEALDELGEDFETSLRGEEAIETYQSAIAAAREPGVDPERLARICLKAARTLTLRWGGFSRRPDPRVMDELIETGLAAARDPVTRSWLLALSGGVSMRWGDSGSADPVPVAERMRRTRQAMEAAAGARLPDLAAHANRILGQLQFSAGEFGAAAATMRSIAGTMDAMDSRFMRAVTALYVALSVADIEGRYEEALPLARLALELGRELSAHEHMHGTFATLWVLHHLGRWAEMDDILREHVEAHGTIVEIVCPFVRSGPLVAALTYAHLGERSRARETAAGIRLTWEQPGLPEILAARIATASGDARKGRELVERIRATHRRPSLEENALEFVALVEALVALGDWEALDKAVPQARAWQEALAILGPMCDRAEGLAARARGDVETSIALLRRAAHGFARLGAPYETARTRALIASALPDSAGMQADAVETAEALLAVGLSSPPGPGREPTAATGHESVPLTDRERQVLELVARGLTNDRIAAELEISPRTVER
ncbi:MAG TPA: AAA family ATPase, partial [Candidatus Limnocylindrales bacterium]|nr:AAA family ATPase [Candidatus Limnocylindrales bacterium]